jgi:hypothetical protein
MGSLDFFSNQQPWENKAFSKPATMGKQGFYHNCDRIRKGVGYFTTNNKKEDVIVVHVNGGI